ncbi:hypothetical protein BaRGS_00013996 [Batillaria attramentaria]|uniref:Uncharacterized protein n=1 Tax=Batillaria attramentaria TaxID=370345 RepID=A0ABD0L608_9CAEN
MLVSEAGAVFSGEEDIVVVKKPGDDISSGSDASEETSAVPLSVDDESSVVMSDITIDKSCPEVVITTEPDDDSMTSGLVDTADHAASLSVDSISDDHRIVKPGVVTVVVGVKKLELVGVVTVSIRVDETIVLSSKDASRFDDTKPELLP